MKQQINEIQEYFIQKIISGDINTIATTGNIITFLIDNQYSFSFFLHTSDVDVYPSNASQFLCKAENNFIILPELTKEQESLLYLSLKPIHSEYQKEVMLKKKRAQIEELKNSIAYIEQS